MSNLLVQNIKHTNGTTAQTIDSSGRVAKPIAVGFKIGATGHNASSPVNGIITQFNNLRTSHCDFNDGSYNTSTCVYTVPVAGIYVVGFNIFAYQELTVEALLRLNGNVIAGMQQNGSDDAQNYESCTATTIAKCAVGDTLDCFSNNRRYHVNTSSSYFFATLIG